MLINSQAVRGAVPTTVVAVVAVITVSGREGGRVASFWEDFVVDVTVVPVVHAYTHRHCTRSRKRQFQSIHNPNDPNAECYIPPLDTSIPLQDANFVLSHDAATGYFGGGSSGGTTTTTTSATSVKGMDNPATHLYAKNQIGSVYDQLEDGARALDLRPKFVWRKGNRRRRRRTYNRDDDNIDNDDDDIGYNPEDDGSYYLDVICHHGAIDISVSLETIIQDTIRWCNDNPDELVLILHHNLAWPSTTTPSASTSATDDESNIDDDQRQSTVTTITPNADTAVSVMNQVYESLGVAYVSCSDLYGFTVGDAMTIGAVSGGGYILAMDQHDAYLTSCAKQNYVEDSLVTCYNANDNKNIPPCTTISPPPPPKKWNRTTGGISSSSSSLSSSPMAPSLAMLQDYIMQSSNNDPTNDSNTLGPPANEYNYLPFNEIQALWQVSSTSAAIGIAHLSSLLDDNTKSHINSYIVQWVYEGLLSQHSSQSSYNDDDNDDDDYQTATSTKKAISLVAIDQVRYNGNALLSVLRTQCGQFDPNTIVDGRDDGGDDDHTLQQQQQQNYYNYYCGKAIPPPLIQNHNPMSTHTAVLSIVLTLVVSIWIWLGYKHYRRHYDHEYHIHQLQNDVEQHLSYVTMSGGYDRDGNVKKKKNMTELQNATVIEEKIELGVMT